MQIPKSVILAAVLGFASVSTGATEEMKLSRLKITGDRRAEIAFGAILSDDGKNIRFLDCRTLTERIVEKKMVTEVLASSDQDIATSVGFSRLFVIRTKVALPRPPRPGKIAAVEQRTIYVNLGQSDGIQNGQRLSVYRGEENIVDPETGRILGKKSSKIAAIEVVDSQDQFSKARLTGDLEIDLHVGDIVRCERPRSVVALLPLAGAAASTERDAIAIQEELTTLLSKSGVDTVERARLSQVIAELSLQQTALFDDRVAQKVGKQLGATAVVVGTLLEDGKQLVANLRLVETDTAKILVAVSVRIPANRRVQKNSVPGGIGHQSMLAPGQGNGVDAIASMPYKRVKNQEPPSPITDVFEPDELERRRDEFTGRWRIVAENGVTACFFTLDRSFHATKSHVPTATANWEIVGDEARITWSDGWRDILRPQQGGRILKIAFGPGTSWNDRPANVQQAIKESPNGGRGPRKVKRR